MNTRIISWQDEQRFRDALLPIALASTLHIIIYATLLVAPTIKSLPIIDEAISVRIVEERSTNPTTAPQVEIEQVIETQPIAQSLPPPPRTAPSNEVPDPQLTQPPPERAQAPTVTAPITTSPHIIAGLVHQGDDDEDKVSSVYIPSRWALEPALSKHRLEGIFGEGFEKDIKCIRSLSEDCKDLRTSVFADYQLSEQDLIWTESFAHSGLTSSDLHGLSEREIRKKLAIPIAGDNAFVILPGIAIDGNFWDSLHGVNKKCPVQRGVRRCPDLAPKADDKRFHIPKKE
ncbi:MAG: hypothetical protein ABJ275_12445 [Maricaulaceae bacterium]